MTTQGSDIPPGWYENPEHPTGPKRWWDGTAWTDHLQTPLPPPPQGASGSTDARLPDLAATPGGPHPDTSGAYPTHQTGFPTVSKTLEGGFHAITRHLKPLSVIAVVCHALPLTVFVGAMFSVFSGWSVSQDQLEGIGGSEFVGLMPSYWPVIPIVGLLAAIMVMAGTLAVAWLLTRSDVDDPEHRCSFGDAWPAISQGFRRTPILLGWVLLLELAFVVAFFGIVSVVTILALMTNAAIFGISILILTLLLLAGTMYLSVKLAFVVFAIADGENVPFRKSWSVSDTRFFAVLGRELVIGLVALIGYAVLNSLGSGIIGRGFVVSSNELSAPSGNAVLPLILTFLVNLLIAIWYFGFSLGAMGRMYRAAHQTQPTPSR